MRQLKFYKNPDSTWFVDLPEWEGSLAELQMVAGADTMLDTIAEGNDKVRLSISETPFNNANELTLKGMADDIGSGAYYTLHKYNGVEINHELWLCDVALWLFGKFPKQIFFKNIELL